MTARRSTSLKINSGRTGIKLHAYLKQIQQQKQKSNEPAISFKVGQGQEMDRVNLSDQAREALQASQSSQGMSDVREEKVAQVKMKVNNGTYKVVGAKAAAGMLREAIENNLILQKIISQIPWTR